MTGLHPEPQRSIEFIRWLTRGSDFHLEHMESDGPAAPKSKTFGAEEVGLAEHYVVAHNGEQHKRNVYFLMNAEFLVGARGKDNISAARFLHVDLDAKDYPGTSDQARDRILGMLADPSLRPKGVPAATAYWFTGGGYQAVWRLAEPMEISAAERLNSALLAAFQGSGPTHDVSRLLRLPSTVNWLNDAKRAAGRVPELSVCLEPVKLERPPVEYGAADFTLKLALTNTPASSASNVSALSKRKVELADLVPLPLPADVEDFLPRDAKWQNVILTGQNPPDKEYSSRSELVLAATVWMLGKGVAPGHVLSIITDPDLPISAHILAQDGPVKYGIRQIARAMAFLDARTGVWPVTEKGKPVSDLPQNVRYALSLLCVDSRRNAFTQSDEVTGFGLEGRDLNDIGDILASAFSRELHFSAAPASIKRELISLAHEATYHPVIEYLDDLHWDGQTRLDSWLATYCGAEDSDLNKEFGSKFLIAGVRRIKSPGVKFDTMLVLEGPQGAGKSQLAARLAVRPEWFCGSLDLKSDDKTKAELLSRAWIVECQELDGISKTASQTLKRFLSTCIDMFRRAYARDASSFARHCIILGTTNEGAYLHDLTGNRRIWPVQVSTIDLKRLATDVDQLWAEAVVRERAGEPIELSKHLWPVAQAAQGKRMVEDAFKDVLEGTFGNRTGRVSMDSVKLLLGLDTARMTPHEARRVRSIMEDLGWETGTHRLFDLAQSEHTQRKGFARGSADERKVEYVAERKLGGAVAIVPASRQTLQEPPF